MWRTPFPDDAELAALYDDAYFERWGADEPASLARVRAMKERTDEALLDRLPERLRGGSLLDVGCAYGFLMGVARRRGHEVHGVEPIPRAAAAARAEFGAERIHEGRLDATAFPGRRFDVLTLVDVLEHVPDPEHFLGSVRERLAPGGRMLAVLPDVSSLAARILRARWPYYGGEHLFHWSPHPLRRFLESRGWMVDAIHTGIRKTFTTRYLTSYATRLGEWLPPGFGRLPDRTLRIATGEMCVVAGPADAAAGVRRDGR